MADSTLITPVAVNTPIPERQPRSTPKRERSDAGPRKKPDKGKGRGQRIDEYA
jgi:hypothetical protein